MELEGQFAYMHRSHHTLSLELVYPKCYMEEQFEQNFLNYINLKEPVSIDSHDQDKKNKEKK